MLLMEGGQDMLLSPPRDAGGTHPDWLVPEAPHQQYLHHSTQSLSGFVTFEVLENILLSVAQDVQEETYSKIYFRQPYLSWFLINTRSNLSRHCDPLTDAGQQIKS